MNKRLKAIYERIAPLVKRMLAEGSTVRALLLSVPGGAVWQEWISPDRFPLWMAAAAFIAAFIPDKLGEP